MASKLPDNHQNGKAMDPVLRVLLCTDTSPTAPQQSFEHADRLLQQAVALREDADDLQQRIKLMYERADTLTNTAQGLQEIALQDREAVQMTWQKFLRIWSHKFEVYITNATNAVCFKEMDAFVEDGVVNMDNLNSFLSDVKDYCAELKRSERSATPEPETPLGLELPATVKSLLKSQSTRKAILKRKASSIDDENEAGIHDFAKDAKRLRQDQGSDEETLVNDPTAASGDAIASRGEGSEGERTETDDDSDGDENACGSTSSSGDSGSESGSSSD